MISPDNSAAIAALDLDPIKVKLMHQESGEGWSLPYANAVEAEYRRYLQLMKLYPSAQVAPGFDVDTFWHYHILDTMKYADDCDVVFGYFLHHFPYVGLRGEEDEQVHAAAGERMQQLYEATFGVPYARDAAAAAGVRRAEADGHHPAGVAFSINPGDPMTSAKGRDPNGVAFSINPGDPVLAAKRRDPNGVEFSINPGDPVLAAGGRDPHGIAFSINPGDPVASASGRGPNRVAFSINPGASLAGASVPHTISGVWPTPSLKRPTLPLPNSAG